MKMKIISNTKKKYWNKFFITLRQRKRLIIYVIPCSGLLQRMIIIVRKITFSMGIMQKGNWIAYQRNFVWLRMSCLKI